MIVYKFVVYMLYIFYIIPISSITPHYCASPAKPYLLLHKIISYVNMSPINLCIYPRLIERKIKTIPYHDRLPLLNHARRVPNFNSVLMFTAKTYIQGDVVVQMMMYNGLLVNNLFLLR